MKPLSIILIFLLCELEAVYEGLEFKGKKELAKIIQGIQTLTAFGLMAIAFVLGGQGYSLTIILYWFVIYLFLRLDFFNIIWNLVTGQKWCYVGVGWYDRNIGKYFMTAPVWMFTIFLTLISILKYKEK